MNLEQEVVNKAFFEAIENNKIPYTQEGFDNLLNMIKEGTSFVGCYEIKIQPVSEISVSERGRRKSPNIEVIVK